jgi:hypothetical protein
MRPEVGTTNAKHGARFQREGGERLASGFEDRIDDNEVASVPIGSLVGTGDMALVAAAKSGSSRAFDALVERHSRRIRRVAQRVTRGRNDAEDV